jgi:hypothetical protein
MLNYTFLIHGLSYKKIFLLPHIQQDEYYDLHIYKRLMDDILTLSHRHRKMTYRLIIESKKSQAKMLDRAYRQAVPSPSRPSMPNMPGVNRLC